MASIKPQVESLLRELKRKLKKEKDLDKRWKLKIKIKELQELRDKL